MALLAPHFNVVQATCQWDCYWYTDLIAHGYDLTPRMHDPLRVGQANWAFFPLYPALGYILHQVVPVSVNTAALLVNVLLWPCVIYASYQHASLKNRHLDPVLFALFFVIFPFNIYYTSQYSEGIFGLLLILALFFLEKKQLGRVALCCFLLSLSRPPGFLAAVFISIWLFCSRFYKKNAFCSLKEGWHYAQESLLLGSAACAGLSCYSLYLSHHMGDGLAFSHIQAAWHRHFGWLPKLFYDALFSKSGRIDDAVLIVFLFCIYKMYQYKWYLEATLMASLIFITSSAGLGSIQRFTFSNPLIMEFLAIRLSGCSKRMQNYILFTLLIMHVLVIISWYHRKKWLT